MGTNDHVSDHNFVSWGICNPQLLSSKLMIESWGPKNAPQSDPKTVSQSDQKLSPKVTQKVSPKSHKKSRKHKENKGFCAIHV